MTEMVATIEGLIVKKSWAQAHDVPYRLLAAQPLTLRERREQERFREEVATRRMAIEKICGARGDSENRGLGGGKVHLSMKERKSLERFIGVPVEDAQDARRKMKERGIRFLERGEETDIRIRAQIEYAESGGEKRGEALPDAAKFPGWDKLGMMKPAEKFDHQARLAYWRHHYGET